jgi:hypothetical protein
MSPIRHLAVIAVLIGEDHIFGSNGDMHRGGDGKTGEPLHPRDAEGRADGDGVPAAVASFNHKSSTTFFYGKKGVVVAPELE